MSKPLKLPLQVIDVDVGITDFRGIGDAEGNVLRLSDKETLEALVALANSHAAQPGAPREDGVWDVRMEDGLERIVERRNGEIFDPLTERVVNEERIAMHRKHEPLEVPNG